MTAREVELSGGAPWGFRMHGGSDQNQPLRISRVNPGRKASLSGIREGDVISSINGRPTRGMSNSDAHAMLRSAGPVLRLGLNEDREMSPRRRSIGKGSELKRPSQLIAEVQKATPQAPVYATIRPSQSPQNRPLSSSMRSSLNSLPSALNSTPLVKSVAAPEEPPRFHPTNPFYSTISSNHSSASKLPVPNGRATLSGLDRNKKENSNDYSDLKSPSFFTRTYEGPSSLPHLHHNENVNGFQSDPAKTANDGSSHFYDKFNHYINQGLPNNMNDKNPFETKRNSDPFEKYLRPDSNGKSEFDTNNIPGSQSETNFRRKEEITERSTITEHKISEVEEVKTIKKIILNGSGDAMEQTTERHPVFSSPIKKPSQSEYFHHSDPKYRSYSETTKNGTGVHTPTHQRSEYFSSSFDKMEEEYRNIGTPTSASRLASDFRSPTAEAPASRPPVKPEAAHAPASPSKREYTSHCLSRYKPHLH